MAGTKHDQDKPMITLVRPEFIEGVAAAMTFGSNKYGRYNYREGIEYSRLLDAMMRHALKWARGEEIDEDSGLSHLLLVASNANMLFDLRKHNIGTDDRIRVSKTLPERGGITYNAVNPDGSINREKLNKPIDES